MVVAIFHAARSSEPVILRWCHVRTHITAAFEKSNPPSLNRAFTLMSPISLGTLG